MEMVVGGGEIGVGVERAMGVGVGRGNGGDRKRERKSFFFSSLFLLHYAKKV